MKYIKIALAVLMFVSAVGAIGYAIKLYKDNQDLNAKANKQTSDSKIVNDANLALSNDGVLDPTSGEDTNIISLAESVTEATASGISISIIKSDNSAIDTDGTITYSDSAVTGEVTFLIKMNDASRQQVVTITVPPKQTSADTDKEQVLNAKEALGKATLRPAEGTDTNIITMAQKIVDEVSDGVIVKIALSDNKQIVTDGIITYTDSAVTGSVKFSLKKNLASSTVTLDITVPAKTSSSQQAGSAIGNNINTNATTTTTTRTTTTTLPPVTTTLPPTTTSTTTTIPVTTTTTSTTTSTTTTTVPPTTTTTTTTAPPTTTTTTSTTTTTIPSGDEADVAAAKAALADLSLYPIEGVDTNVIPIAQDVIDSTVLGVTVGITESNNTGVASNGDITYGGTTNEGNVTFSLIKGSANDSQDVNVIIAARVANVLDYGATGDDSSDDTNAIQAAIDYIAGLGGGNVIIPNGTYMVDSVTSIYVRSNINLLLFDNASLQAIGNSSESYKIVNFYNVTNASINGGNILGDRDIHTGTTGEWGMGINIAGSNNIQVSDISVSDCWGDGIYLGSTGSQNFNNNVLIENFIADNNRRQGISIISAKNLIIKNGMISNTNGTEPSDGIDLEPNNASEFLQNILIENIQSINNGFIGSTMGGYGLEFALTNVVSSPNPINITVNNFTDSGSYRGNISTYTGYNDSMCNITINQNLDPATGWTNLITNGNFINTENWTPTGATISTTDNILSATGDGTQQYPYIMQNTSSSGAIGDKIYVRGYLKADKTDTSIGSMGVYLKVDGATNYFPRPAQEPELDRWYNVSGVMTLTNSGNISMIGRFYYPSAPESNGKTVLMKDFMAINLTQLYGTGNEPSSGECEDLFPNISLPTTTTTNSTTTTTSSTTTTINQDAQDVALAKASLAAVSLYPIEGTDTNVVPVAQAIVDSTVSGVTIGIAASSNSGVASNGDITYGGTASEGNVTFSLTKGFANDIQDVNVIVPIHHVLCSDLGMIPNDEAQAQNNYNILLNEVRLGTLIFVDNIYYLYSPFNGSVAENLVSDVNITGISPDLSKLIIKGGTYFNLKGDGDIQNITIDGPTSTLSNIFTMVAPFTNNIIVKNNYITGNIRMVISSVDYGYDYASTQTEITDLTIENNEMYDIYVGSGGTRSFIQTIDTPVRMATIKNNNITNFSYSFYYNGINNDNTAHQDYLYENSNALIEGNLVKCTNDYDPKVKNGGVTVMYYNFALIEGFRVEVRNNTFEGFHISDASDTVVYDNYLSVTQLLYEGNIYKNIVNFTTGDTYVDIMKSKNAHNVAGFNTERIYRNNTYIMEPAYADYFGKDRFLLRKEINTYSNDMDYITVEDNNFDLYILSFKTGSAIHSFSFQRNIIQMDTVEHSVGWQNIVFNKDIKDELGSFISRDITFSNNTITSDSGPFGAGIGTETFYLFNNVSSCGDLSTVNFNNNTINYPDYSFTTEKITNHYGCSTAVNFLENTINGIEYSLTNQAPATTTTTTTISTTTTTLPSGDEADVAAAKAVLASVSLHPIEGVDTNVIPIAQSIVNTAVSGVIVGINSSSNSQVAGDGTISYGSDQVEDDVIFSLTKGSANDLQNILVIVDARTVNIEDYGATGDDSSDDTTYINNAITYVNSLGGGNVYIPDGTYIITAPYDWGNAIIMKDNVNLLLSTNANIEIASNSYNGYGIIGISNVSNILITGGSIIGDKDSHTGSTGEWGMGINVEGSNNIVISDISISDCWGDGIYIGSTASQKFSQNITISNFILDNNRRQGISIISAKNLIIQDGTISNTNGTPPQSAIDVEPNSSDEWAYDIQLINITTINNGLAEYDTGFGGWGFDVWFGCGTENEYTTPLNQVSISVSGLDSTGNLRGNITTNAYGYIDYGYDITLNP